MATKKKQVKPTKKQSNPVIPITVEQELNDPCMIDPSFEGVPEGLYIPLGNRVLILECSQQEQVTVSGIIMPGSKDVANSKLGIVYRKGSLVNPDIKIGMRVCYGKESNLGLSHNGKFYHDVDQFFINAIVPPSNYITPYIPGFEDKKRADRIDNNKRALKKVDEVFDKIVNG